MNNRFTFNGSENLKLASYFDTESTDGINFVIKKSNLNIRAEWYCEVLLRFLKRL